MSRNSSSTGNESRRGFLRGSSILLASALPNPHPRQTISPLKVGLIGCGRSGVKLTDKLLKRGQALGLQLELAAFCDAFDDRIQQALRSLKGRNGASFKLLANGRAQGIYGFQRLVQLDLDAVMIAAPPAFRAAMAEAAIAAGKHVFIEQPVAVDPEGSSRLMRASTVAADSNLVLHIRNRQSIAERHGNHLAYLKAGALGEIREVVQHSQLPKASRKSSRFTEHVSQDSAQSKSNELRRLRDWKAFPEYCGDGTLSERVALIEFCNLLWECEPKSVKVQSQVHYGGHGDQDANAYLANAGSITPGSTAAERLDSTLRFEFGNRGILASRCQVSPQFGNRHRRMVIRGSRGYGELSSGKFYDHSNRLLARIPQIGNDGWHDLDAFLMAVHASRNDSHDLESDWLSTVNMESRQAIRHCAAAITGQQAGHTGQPHRIS